MRGRYQLTVLLVDDDGNYRDALGQTLERMGCLVKMAASESEAQCHLAAWGVPPDIVISDQKLHDHGDPRDYSGLCFLVGLKRGGVLRSGIILTGFPDEQARQVAMRMGVSYYTKGEFGFDMLKSVLDSEAERVDPEEGDDRASLSVLSALA